MSVEVKIETALERLHKFDKQGIHVYRKSDLRRLFFDDSLTAFQQSLPRLVAYFGAFRSVISGLSDHPFRFKPITD
ncbi:hypothetical protein P3392_17795, partial [Vibrio parahaemolyticus]|nr:hypothetical protein [Vibrio parahaemolyticus]MDF4358415.1 hypothetical protein [Vibrio parahaemolyticus]MDF4418684.1 hypothetical protein [Vibrio parahaemolyticus]MDF4526747.1 hypothetical protein [Vibrio parahaemolyticus]MDF4553944.1 hypothetical protein [Vibrio parahaemolyticus]